MRVRPADDISALIRASVSFHCAPIDVSAVRHFATDKNREMSLETVNRAAVRERVETHWCWAILSIEFDEFTEQTEVGLLTGMFSRMACRGGC